MHRMSPSKDALLDALRSVQDPDLHRDIVTLGFVKELEVEGGLVRATIELTTPACPVREELQSQCEHALAAVEGVERVEVEMTARVRDRSSKADDLIPNVKQCIAVASGKGGVGKSTVTLNLALALSERGARVGLLDADVYGPSIPLMMGCNERPVTDGAKILPVERHGLRLMSLGFLLEDDSAVLWRGPMVAGTVKQLLTDVDWGELDYLLVDLPPGTGDAPMSLAQLVPLTGVVIVATPQHVAANIAGKSVQLFRRLNAPILGVVENMAGFACPQCGHVSQIFAGLSGAELAARHGVPFLGSVPLDPAISAASDDGRPALLADPDGQPAQAFRAIAGELVRHASILSHEAEPVNAGG